MTTSKTVLTETSDREIVITRVVNAPPELVWDAMTKPEHVVHWWGPNGFTSTIKKMDVRPGGVWDHTMHGPDGANYPNYKVFKEVVPPSRLTFSHGGVKEGGSLEVKSEGIWTFDPVEEGKTLVTIRMIFASARMREQVIKEYGAIEGGNQTLARLGEFVAKAPVVVERTFNASVETVWKALTEIDQMKQWYFDTLADFKPEVGFATKVNVHHVGQDFLHLWKVTEAVPNKKIAYTWRYEAHHGESLVTFELFPQGKGTRLKLTHTGLETFEGEKFPKYARGNFLKGWTSLAGSLAEYLGEKS
jgi:uncharacterized protein YndB with AHSA1/START domain